MNQRQWIHVGPYRRHNRIGIMHGAESGNLMIYYNDKIILIDFKVFDSRSYKFFVDDELCEISIIKNKKGYKYKFKFDTKTQTPLNQSRKKKIKKMNKRGITIMVAVPLTLLLIVLGYVHFRKNFLDHRLKNNSETEWATTRIITKGINNHYEYLYLFKGDMGMKVASKPQFSTTPPTTSHGIPLDNGDVFAVRYVKGYDFYHRINYNQPDSATAVKLMQRVAEQHINQNQGRMQKELLCEVQVAFDMMGVKGLATIYHQQTPSSENTTYNRDAYLRLIRDTPFVKAYDICLLEQ